MGAASLTRPSALRPGTERALGSLRHLPAACTVRPALWGPAVEVKVAKVTGAGPSECLPSPLCPLCGGRCPSSAPSCWGPVNGNPVTLQSTLAAQVAGCPSPRPDGGCDAGARSRLSLKAPLGRRWHSDGQRQVPGALLSSSAAARHLAQKSPAGWTGLRAATVSPPLPETRQRPRPQDGPGRTPHRTRATRTEPPRAAGAPGEGLSGAGRRPGACRVLPRASCGRPGPARAPLPQDLCTCRVPSPQRPLLREALPCPHGPQGPGCPSTRHTEGDPARGPLCLTESRERPHRRRDLTTAGALPAP